MNRSDSGDEARRERERLFVGIAIKNSLVTDDQIEAARGIQVKIADLGVSPKFLGEILVDQGALDQDKYERIVRKMGRLERSVRIKGYKLLARLGQGSMGTVYRARHIAFDRIVAVKVLAPFLHDNERFVKRFIKEARTLARMHHPNIVDCVDIGLSENQYYLAMEFCDGPTVLDLIKRSGALPEERAVRCMVQVARALEHAYDHNIVHRDIKPDNIMMVTGGVAKLCDLGLVKELEYEGSTTDTGAALGTPNYISPEQARGEEDVDFRTDIYSLGVTFYHMVTGYLPFESPNAAVVMLQHINDPPMPPKDKVPSLDSDTSRLILKMMRKVPEDRHKSPSALVKDLEKLLARLTGEKLQNPSIPTAPRPRRRRRR